MIFITREEDLQIDLPLQSLYFYVSRDPFHQKFLTMIEVVENEYEVPFFAIDADQFSNFCKRFAVNNVPLILILKDGMEIKRINGLVSTDTFKRTYADICIAEPHKRS